MSKILFAFSFLFSFCIHLQAQLDSNNQVLFLKGDYIEEGKIMLRWLPPSPGYWQVMNYYGYKIERAILPQNTKDNLVWKTLIEKHLPLSLDQWREKAKLSKDTMFIAAGQAVHGYRGRPMRNLDSLADRAAELKNYFTAITFTVEFSQLAATSAALGYIDSELEKGNSYIYRVTPLSTDKNYILNLNTVLVQTNEVFKLPIIVASEIREGEKATEIFWDKLLYKDYYSAFNVYKSFDGKTFTKYNDIPFNYSAFKDDSKFIFRDSFEKNYVKCYYKLEGISSYAIKGPMSDVMVAQAKDRTAPKPPVNIKTTYLGNSKMKIEWQVDPMDNDIAGFRISRSNKVDKGFVELTTTMLPANTRSFIDEGCNELLNNYYFIGVLDKEGNASVSMPEHGTIIDSIPPTTPKGLAGSIDSAGIVTLHWQIGDEPDLLGYVVHFSNDKKLTFYNKTDYALKDTIWRDTIPLNVLTEEIHYKIRALDHRFNPSPFTTILTLKKPDLVPPTSPIITQVENSPQGIQLTWANSNSHDVENYVLERREEKEKTFSAIYTSQNRDEYGFYIDKKVEPGKIYYYQVYAMDDASLKSKIAGVVSIKAFLEKKVAPIKMVNYKINKEKQSITLSWDYANFSNYQFVIYKSINQGPYLSYMNLDGKLSFTDQVIKKETIVKYKIKVINRQKWQSDFSTELVASIQ
jgi:uncharacterized protein